MEDGGAQRTPRTAWEASGTASEKGRTWFIPGFRHQKKKRRGVDS